MIARSRFSLVAALALVAGCVGEASVTYKGTVTVGTAATAGYSFDAEPNPGALAPLAGAEVVLCVSSGECNGGLSAVTGADGAWGPLEQVFGGFVGSEEFIEVRVSAEGFEPFTYRVSYEKTDDPTNAQQFLNVRLAPLAAD